MFDPQEELSIAEEPLTVQDWMNIITVLDVISAEFAKENPDSPLPSDMDITMLRARSEFQRVCAENPEDLVNALIKSLGVKNPTTKDSNTNTPKSDQG